MSKYGPLRQLLQRHGQTSVEMAFDEIADIVGGLPSSAYRHRAWWSNHRGRHVQAAGWLDAGRAVEHVDLAAQRVRFSAPHPRDR